MSNYIALLDGLKAALVGLSKATHPCRRNAAVIPLIPLHRRYSLDIEEQPA